MLFVAYLLTKIILVADFIVLDPFMTDFMILNVVMLCDIFLGVMGLCCTMFTQINARSTLKDTIL